MPPAGLIDTGAIVAIVDSDDYWHSACTNALSSGTLPLFTTEAVLTEAFRLEMRIEHLLSHDGKKAFQFDRTRADRGEILIEQPFQQRLQRD